MHCHVFVNLVTWTTSTFPNEAVKHLWQYSKVQATKPAKILQALTIKAKFSKNCKILRYYNCDCTAFLCNWRHLIWLAWQQLILTRRSFKLKKDQSNLLLKQETILSIITDSVNPESYNEECKYLFEITMLKLSKWDNKWVSKLYWRG